MGAVSPARWRMSRDRIATLPAFGQGGSKRCRCRSMCCAYLRRVRMGRATPPKEPTCAGGWRSACLRHRSWRRPRPRKASASEAPMHARSSAMAASLAGAVARTARISRRKGISLPLRLDGVPVARLLPMAKRRAGAAFRPWCCHAVRGGRWRWEGGTTSAPSAPKGASNAGAAHGPSWGMSRLKAGIVRFRSASPTHARFAMMGGSGAGPWLGLLSN